MCHVACAHRGVDLSEKIPLLPPFSKGEVTKMGITEKKYMSAVEGLMNSFTPSFSKGYEDFQPNNNNIGSNKFIPPFVNGG
jgi:hypothetical protein